MKRYYFKNREIDINGFHLSITTNGATYHVDKGTYRRLDAIWFGKLGYLAVTLPDETTVKLRPTAKGIEKIKNEKV